MYFVGRGEISIFLSNLLFRPDRRRRTSLTLVSNKQQRKTEHFNFMKNNRKSYGPNLLHRPIGGRKNGRISAVNLILRFRTSYRVSLCERMKSFKNLNFIILVK